MKAALKGELSKKQIVECAAKLFLEKGYNATGINEIITNAGLSKGSFYFYFAGKRELAVAVAEYYGQKKISEITAWAAGKVWPDFIENMANAAIKRAQHQQNFGCPMAVFGMETAMLEPEIAAKNYEALTKMMDIFEEVLLRSGLTEHNARVWAERALAMYEGRLLLYRLSKDIRELEKALSDLKALPDCFKK